MSGAFAAVASAALWAFASTRYAQASRAVGSARVNLTRASTVLPLFLVATLVTTRGHLFAGIDGTRAAWLGLSVLCAYGFADNVFFAAARRLGITTALAIASSYPLWAALVGTLWRHERFGVTRAAGTLLCVGGIIALIMLSPRAVDEHEHAHSTKRDAREGILLALLTSVLWAGNTISIKLGGTGIEAWHANLIRFFIAWPILAATSALTTRPTPDDATARAAYRGLIVPSLLEACVGSSLFVYGLAHTDLAVGATLSSL
ncbi:MAG TPA: EamA family transporter, partial [Polyangia bacterium]